MMIYVILILASVALFAGFLAWTAREARTGTRLFANVRDAFDEQVATSTKMLGQVDLAALIFHFLRDALKRVVHDVAHVSLALVEALQGMLRRLVVRLRGHTPLHRGNPGAFVEYMTRGTRAAKKDVESAAPSEGNGAL